MSHVKNVPAYKLAVDKSMPKIEAEQVRSADDSVKFCRNFFHDDLTLYESMFIVLLSKMNRPIGYAKISQGGVAGTVVDPKIVMKYAVESLASGIILCHNHPSGNLKPSTADDDITRRINEACKLLDTQLLDHIILTETSYYSYRESSSIL
jgi:DNA repair protein RadC